MLEENKQGLIESFTNRCVRDLAWVIASPPLVSGEFTNTRWWNHEKCLQEYNDCLGFLHDLDKNPTPLLNHLNRIKSKRLGLRFEAFVAFWFDKVSPNFKLFAKNIQLFEHSENKRTLGEIDFIVIDKHSSKLIHLEVAVKFYLGTSHYSDPYRWFGTNIKDQLGKKLDHLKQHQTQLLLKHPDKIASVLNNQKIDERHCIIKGRLFYPLDPKEKSTPPIGVTENHLTGHYIHHKDCETFHEEQTKKNRKIIQLNKKDWLSELLASDIKTHQLQNSFLELDRPQCYALMENKKGDIIEKKRIFYLPHNFRFPTNEVCLHDSNISRLLS